MVLFYRKSDAPFGGRLPDVSFTSGKREEAANRNSPNDARVSTSMPEYVALTIFIP